MAGSLVARRWTSIIRTQDKAAYTDYLRRTGASDYGATDGNLGYQMMLRDLGDGTTEVVIISWWASINAIRAYAGEDHRRARYYPEDDRYLLEKPATRGALRGGHRWVGFVSISYATGSTGLARRESLLVLSRGQLQLPWHRPCLAR